MKSFTKFAVAAVLVIGVLFGINYFGGSIDGSSVVWADVLQQVKQVQTVVYKMSIKMDFEMLEAMPEENRMNEVESYVMASDEYGMKTEIFMGDKLHQIMYLLPKEKLMISLMPEDKKFIRMELTDDEMLAKMRQDSNDPRYMASQMMGSEYIELGFDEIDGVQVEGFEVANPALLGGIFEDYNTVLWVDVVSGWPVRIEMDGTMQMGEKSMHMVMHDFQWDVELDPAEFVPDIPDDYTAMANMHMPKINADSAVQGLRMFADMAGKYPDKLNIMSIVNEVTEIKTGQLKQEFEARKAARENMIDEELLESVGENAEASKEQLMQEIEKEMGGTVEELMPIMAVGSFYMKLVQEKRDPMYYGETIGPDDGDLILLRWRLDSGEYTVIYGDLRTETVSADRLAELESTIQN